ncbi:MAG TPA: 16S rRNA (cytidine(1402)-2'-O)-methyltransferase [Halanaerobiales bacterium]|nr:16S rRNA (cytidine(1402)-2'-O)-methyltransferase [Halanaerobiales bacterium]
MSNKEKGKLYPCATPIGNLSDLSPRAVEVLKEVDIIAAEDTRRTSKLLNHFEIDTKMISYHEHNEKKRAEELIQKIKNGIDLALVSDAGTPGISDPGYEIIKSAVKNQIEVIPIPGPNAALLALIASGMDMSSFVFLGFIPRKGKKRNKFIKSIQKEEKTSIIYESPYRVLDTLKELKKIMGKREIALIRELTKVHEEKIYGTATELVNILESRKIKGEIVLVIEGRKVEEKEGWEDLSIVEHVRLLMENGYTKKKAIKEVSDLRELPKSDVYEKAIIIDAREYL